MAGSRDRDMGAAGMSEPRMPTTLPSPVDRGEFRFVAYDGQGREWRWVDEEMVWVQVRYGTSGEPRESDPSPETH